MIALIDSNDNKVLECQYDAAGNMIARETGLDILNPTSLAFSAVIFGSSVTQNVAMTCLLPD